MIGRASAGLLCFALGVILAPALYARQETDGRRDARAATALERAAAAQAPEAVWNSPRVRALIGQAIRRRARWAGDGGLLDYQAHARGHIYFLFDLGRGTERHLVKADQLALNLFWRAPDQAHQVIVGRREKKVLPTGIQYHLDHLTVVMDNFGDRIRLGEGSEVRDALHPAAPGALDFYDFRLADSLALVMPDREVRVYKVEMRPKDPNQPGLVGAMYLDRVSADIVQMEFTFTAASYLDSQLDYINVRLESALWDGRYWLPHRQGLELRRELQALAFPAGGIIRAEFKISDYRFNTGVPADLFRGPSITYLPARTRERFEFEEGLYDALDPSVAVAPPSMEAIRQEATRIVTESYLRRAEHLRLAVPGVSSVLRFRRAEGLYAGPALTHTFPGRITALALAGRAFGADRWEVTGSLRVPLHRSLELSVVGYRYGLADVSPWPSSSGALATLAALVDGEDYRDPYWTSGATAGLSGSWGAARARLSLAWQSWEPANLEAGDLIDRSYRPVRTLDDGEVAWIAVEVERRPVGAIEAVGGTTWGARVEAAARAVAGDFDYVHAAVRAERFWPTVGSGIGLRLSGAAGAVGGGRIPAQRLFPVGGRGTVRGYRFHDFVGTLYGAVATELTRDLRYPFLSLAVFADVGWVGIGGGNPARAVAVWNQADASAGGSRGPLIGVGAGLGLLFDVVRVELARGLREGGIWELVVKVRPEFWKWM